MSELIVARPALKLQFAASVPLDLTSAVSLVYRATDPSQFDDWLVEARRSLAPEVQHDLDTLLGFSGQHLYYVEELLMSFDPLQPAQLEADFATYITHLRQLPPERYQRMVAQALHRVYHDRGITEAAPDPVDRVAWRAFVEPGITRGDLDEVVDLVLAPEQLKARTVSLLDRFWNECYKAESERPLRGMRRALRQVSSTPYPSIAIAFEELSGHRLPDEIQRALPSVERATFCPSGHLGNFVQFILYPPELILYFDCQRITEMGKFEQASPASPDLLSGLRALADGTRLRIVEILADRELYAQEIVGRLAISQSAVSRHLAMLEATGIVTVRPVNGMKYYAINARRLRLLAEDLERIVRRSSGAAG
jgi:DNA-binding transcriptional ArsR family regulator